MTTYCDVCILGVKWMDKEVVATLSTVDDCSIVEFQGHTARVIVNYPEASNHSCL